MSKNKKKSIKQKNQLHPFNKHRGRYKFEDLIKSLPKLKSFVRANKHSDWSIDFADPKAVKMLNTALLLHHYDIEYWDIPEDYLCPPIPGRADYIHYVADLLAKKNNGRILKGDKIRCLDIGVGANCIYPIVGTSDYGWTFIGTDIDEIAIDSAKKIIALNPRLEGQIELRLQADKSNIFKHIIKEDEYFDLTICNPPFHSSKKEATEASERKFYNIHETKDVEVVANFAGQNHELYTDGGEKGMIQKMILESKEFANSCFWFTTLVSKKTNLPIIYNFLDDIEATEVKTIPMHHGNKSSRIVAWTFLDKKQQKAWAELRWETINKSEDRSPEPEVE